MDNCKSAENPVVDMLTEQVLEAHDAMLGRAETAFFNVAGVNIENEVFEAARMA